ncbi:hypothetical protein CAEBREN_22250 [Caenorhabditis brenneri]|uniref:Uncharacterized protein n=1 Tax=Caenorhabditis brenneri TaxID=135651 RepID=G0MFK9_CAEBE|nr:hypothetical protein CAEBREN_22250 [Caenorhabditis brenneri]
MSSALDFNQF